MNVNRSALVDLLTFAVSLIAIGLAAWINL
jgi:hypothetical protein